MLTRNLGKYARLVIALVAIGLLALVLSLPARTGREVPYHRPPATDCVWQRSEPPNYGKHHPAHPHAHWVHLCAHPAPPPAPQGYQGITNGDQP